jgi:hypothetical protein
MTKLNEVLLTRRALAEWLTAQGFRISYSTLTKICSPAINTGPPTEAYWGRFPMHSPSRGLDWARNRLRPVKAPAPRERTTATKHEPVRRRDQLTEARR